MKRSAAKIVCSSPKHSGKVAHIALISRYGDTWVPVRPENITGSNPRLRGAKRVGNVTSQTIITATGEPATKWWRVIENVSESGFDGAHVRYQFRCPLCRYTLPVTEANLDRVLNRISSSGVWHMDLHTLAAILGK